MSEIIIIPLLTYTYKCLICKWRRIHNFSPGHITTTRQEPPQILPCGILKSSRYAGGKHGLLLNKYDSSETFYSIFIHTLLNSLLPVNPRKLSCVSAKVIRKTRKTRIHGEKLQLDWNWHATQNK